MNRLTIIGNLVKAPDMRTVETAKGPVNACDFTVAVSNKKKDDPTYFRCTAWRGLADLIANYCTKGSKVCVVGPVDTHVYTANDGTAKATMDVTVDEFEFC